MTGNAKGNRTRKVDPEPAINPERAFSILIRQDGNSVFIAAKGIIPESWQVPKADPGPEETRVTLFKGDEWTILSGPFPRLDFPSRQIILPGTDEWLLVPGKSETAFGYDFGSEKQAERVYKSILATLRKWLKGYGIFEDL